MFDIGWTELAVIIIVALIVVGPKDLPMLLKTVGGWVRKARMLTREFQSSVDDMVREAELDEVRKQALELKQLNVSKQIEKTIDPTGSLRNAFDPEADAKAGPKADARAVPAKAVPKADKTESEADAKADPEVEATVARAGAAPVAAPVPVDAAQASSVETPQTAGGKQA